MPPYLILALIAAVGYSIGGLFNKQAMADGCEALRVTLLTVWATALLLLPFAALNPTPLPLEIWYQPVITSICFSLGSIGFIYALRTGDLSVVAPVSGLKPIINALLVAGLLGTAVEASTWLACVLSAIALIILRTPNTTTHHTFIRTAAVTLSSSFCFALCDTCFQQWASGWGVFRFGALVFSLSAIAFLGLIPFFRVPWKTLSKTAKSHVLIGSGMCAIPGLCMAVALGKYGHAPEVNVIYSTRALLSILAVRHIGKFIGGTEHTTGHAIFARRIIGALILMSAIALILFS
jgi:uncharacterized membrane protein